MIAVQRSGLGRRQKGNLHSKTGADDGAGKPKGRGNKALANPHLKRGGPTYPGDLDSSAAPKTKAPKSLGSKELDATREWLLGELRQRGLAEPRVQWAQKGRAKEATRIQVKDGNRKFGLSMDVGDFIARSDDAIEALFRLPGSVTLELERELTRPLNPILFGIVDSVLEGQRAVVRSLLHGENGTVKADTHAYRVQETATHAWLEGARDEQLRALRIATNGVLNTASKAAAEKHVAWEKTGQREGAPTWWWRRSLALSIDRVNLERAGRDLWVTLKLLVGKDAPQLRFKAHARGPAGWADLRRIESGEWERRAARLVWDDDRRQWLLKISVLKPKADPQQGVGAMVVCPNLDGSLQVRGSDGWKAPMDDTPNLLARMFQLDSRKSERSRHRNYQGRGARGRGRKRFNKLLDGLGTKLANAIDTNQKTEAHRVVRLARGERLGKHGWAPRMGAVAVVLVNDMGSAVPTLGESKDPVKNSKLRRQEKLLRRARGKGFATLICWALRKNGIAHQLIKATNHCPACGEAKLVRYCGHEWCCPKCHMKAPRDLWTAWQTFVAGGESPHYNLENVGKAFRRAADFAEGIRTERSDGIEETDQAVE